jgi:proteasome lid subunit RPN8/RPN11
VITLRRSQLDQIVSQAHEAAPEECCGLLGGQTDGTVATIYRLRNVAQDKTVSYEAAPEELFAAQRQMRELGELLLGIYHSHPRASQPEPSSTDIRLAYYPQAVYFIVGLAGNRPVVRAFQISEPDAHWNEVEYGVAGE